MFSPFSQLSPRIRNLNLGVSVSRQSRNFGAISTASYFLIFFNFFLWVFSLFPRSVMRYLSRKREAFAIAISHIFSGALQIESPVQKKSRFLRLLHSLKENFPLNFAPAPARWILWALRDFHTNACRSHLICCITDYGVCDFSDFWHLFHFLKDRYLPSQ